MLSKRILLGSTGIALLLSSVSFAMPQVPIIPLDTKPGQTYVTIDAQYSGVPEDDFPFLETCPFGGENSDDMVEGRQGQHCDREDKTPFIDASHSIDAYGGGGIIGITGDHPWWGSRQRFELGFGIIGGDRSESRSEYFEGKQPPPDTFQMAYENENQVCEDFPNVRLSCGGYDRHEGITASVKTDYDAFNIVARTLIDFEVSNHFTITPNFGVVYRHTERDVHATGAWIDEDNEPEYGADRMYSQGRGYNRLRLPTDQNDLVKTNELGVELGTTLSYDLSSAFKIFGGVNGEVLYREGHFDRTRNNSGGMGGGHDECNTPSLQPPDNCDVHTVSVSSSGGGYNRRVSDDTTDTAVNVTLSLGASYRFAGGTTLSVIGYAQNESYLVVKDQKHQQSNEPTTLSPSNGGGEWQSSRLESERDWTPGVVVALTIPFGGG